MVFHRISQLAQGATPLETVGTDRFRSCLNQIPRSTEIIGSDQPRQDQAGETSNACCWKPPKVDATEKVCPHDGQWKEAHDGMISDVRVEDAHQGIEAQPCHTYSANGYEESTCRHVPREDGSDKCTKELKNASHKISSTRDAPSLLRSLQRWHGCAQHAESWHQHSKRLRNSSRSVDSVGLSARIHVACAHGHLRGLQGVVQVAKEDGNTNTSHDVFVEKVRRYARTNCHTRQGELRGKVVKEQGKEGTGVTADVPPRVTFGNNVCRFKRVGKLAGKRLEVMHIESFRHGSPLEQVWPLAHF
mmetsp:Transcript_75877/g.175929  ORF Transcript_75877/g.175929 Transcript_75877/m.175929 type:complete len:303 (+) Transcript_75877:1145-2053(+)